MFDKSKNNNQLQPQQNGSGAEKLYAFYLNPKAVSLTGEILWRVELDNRRFYRRNNGEAFLGVTGFISSALPAAVNKGNEYWRNQRTIELGASELVEQFLQEMADYGTLFHEATGNVAKSGRVVWGEFTEWAKTRLSAIGLGAKSLDMSIRDFRRDFAAIMEFFKDYRVEILAVEVPVYASAPEIAPNLFKPSRSNAKNPSPQTREGLGTCVDLVVEMDKEKYKEKTPANKRERSRAIINLKSGRKAGVSEQHTFQLIAERALFNARFGSTFGNISRIFNLSPKAWRGKTPTYTLTEHTEKAAGGLEEQFTYFLKLAQMRGVLCPPQTAGDEFTGTTMLGDSAAENIKPIPFQDLFKNLEPTEPSEPTELSEGQKSALEFAKNINQKNQ